MDETALLASPTNRAELLASISYKGPMITKTMKELLAMEQE